MTAQPATRDHAISELPTLSRFRDQPAAVFLVAMTEFWERFSYYGLTAMLVLFLAAPIEEGGLGWSRSGSLQAYGIFAGLAFSLPMLGGWMSDRFLGEQRAVRLGGIGIAIGNLSMFAAASVSGIWRMPAVAVGLTLIIVGTGLLKSPISALVGRVYDVHPTLPRQTGYTLFLVGVWMGSVAGSIFSGAFGEVLGWRWGFLASALGMTVGLAIYLIRAPTSLGEVGLKPSPAQRPEDDGCYVDDPARPRIVAIVTMIIFTAVYAAAFYQKAGVLNLMIREQTDRTIGAGLVVPAAMFLTISTAGFVLLAPLFDKLQVRLAQRGILLDVFLKQAGGLLALAIGYVFFDGAAAQSAGSLDGLHSVWWIIAGYLCFAVGDVLIWPPQISTISMLAPRHLLGVLIGAWFVTVGIGNTLAGFIGSLSDGKNLLHYFVSIQIGLIVAVVLILMLRILRPDLVAITMRNQDR